MSHYFENDQNLPSNLKKTTVSLLKQNYIFYTDNGVFSKHGLDYGSRLLLESLPYEELKKKYRQKCKALVLALHYGMSPQSMSHQLDMTLDDTKKLMQAYFDRYPKTKQQIDECVAYAKRTGEILTVFGDRLRCDKSRASTQGFNYRLQNGASVAMQAKQIWSA